jgi:hypothetical protein
VSAGAAVAGTCPDQRRMDAGEVFGRIVLTT